MDTREIAQLLTSEGISLLGSLPAYTSSTDVVKIVADLRKEGHDPLLVAAVLTQAKLRTKAQSKFGPFGENMLFTEAGLEQATRLPVAAQHAGRFLAAGITTVADLGCGIGADALALSSVGIHVTAVDADEVTAALATYNLSAFPETQVLHAQAEDVDLTGIAGVYLDPARRTAGHHNTQRLTKSEDYSPSLDFAFGLSARFPTGIKLGPGFDRDLIPSHAEAQWISVDGDVVELGLWFGSLKREGITRAALVIDSAGTHEMTATADSADAEIGDLQEYLYEPDGAVIRARLIGDLARELDAHMIAEGIAYMTAAEPQQSPFAHGFKIIEEFPLDIKTLTKELKSRGIGTLEIKKRGVDIDPAEFRKKLKLQGKNNATLFLTRVGQRRVALLAERLR